MKFSFWKLLLWYLVYDYLLRGVVHSYIATGEVEKQHFFVSIIEYSSTFSLFLYALCSYATLYIGYPKKKWLLIAVGALLSFIAPMVFRFLLEQKLMYALLDHSNYPQRTKLDYYIWDQYMFSIRSLIFGVLYYFIRYSFYNQEQQQELVLANKNMQLESLMSQINPHFLLNSLNNIQSLIVAKSDHASDALENLSEILKYSLYGGKTTCTIADEMKVVRQFIELQNLRLVHTPNLEIEIDESVLSKEIPQYTIIPLVENLYKHAVLDDPEYPCILEVKSVGDKLSVRSSNNINQGLKDAAGGIGLDNLEKRLILLYPEQLHFKIDETITSYQIVIEIPNK